MKRRQFITLLGGAVAAWPLVAGAQQSGPMRRIGVITSVAADDPETYARMAAFHQGLQEAGWIIGSNVQIEYRWGGAGDAERIREYSDELVGLSPDVILAVGVSTVGPLQRTTRTIPIIFVQVTDPVGAGFVASLARPGGNATGFATYEFGISVKWLELLKEIAPSVTRVSVLRDPTLATGIGLLAAMQGVAPALRVDLTPVGVGDAGEIERAVVAFAREQNGGLIVLPGPLTTLHRKLISTLAVRHHLPTIYPYRFYVADGGLSSYGPNSVDQFRLAAGYVDRILKGEKPADLPVQAPTKYRLVINLKTAKALGLDVPPSLLARADEVIE
ncbi:MAG TPA: ABC transporter substrate-binding protein [Bradyrhizobium sp.]|nr:ABC transporter substrate-binding protein [Bradyrhizobium sp.]